MVTTPSVIQGIVARLYLATLQSMCLDVKMMMAMAILMQVMILTIIQHNGWIQMVMAMAIISQQVRLNQTLFQLMEHSGKTQTATAMAITLGAQQEICSPTTRHDGKIQMVTDTMILKMICR